VLQIQFYNRMVVLEMYFKAKQEVGQFVVVVIDQSRLEF